MKTVFHIVGYTQFYGTCKMHLFKDCGLLTKRRRDANFKWGTRTGTSSMENGDIVEIEDYEGENFCKACLRREGKV